MKYSAKISMRQNFLEHLMKQKQKALIQAPQGILRIIRHKKGWQYYHRKGRDDKNGTYIRKEDFQFAQLLAQKEYNQKIVEAARSELKLLEEIGNFYNEKTVEKIYNSFSKPFQDLLIPVQEPLGVYLSQWTEIQYKGKKFYKDSPEFYTDRGKRMRSKSEVMIANLLSQFRIPYHYEKPMVLKGIGSVYPDFTLLDLENRQEIYWEHLGMMDEKDYCEKAINKISSYIANGLYPGKRLILSFETSKQPLDMIQIQSMILEYASCCIPPENLWDSRIHGD